MDHGLSSGLADAAHRVHLNDLLDLPQPAELRAIYDAMDNETRHRGRRETVLALVKRTSAEKPVLIRIEDIHWADRIMLEQLASLASTTADDPVILVMTSRIEGDPIDHVWRGRSGSAPFMAVDLAALGRGEALDMAHEFGELSEQMVRICIERAEGNPLFLEQLLRSAEEHAEEDLPGTVQSIVQARLDRLEPVHRQALQSASVMGQRFTLAELRHVLGDEAYSCEALVAHVLVRPEGESYLFGHALIREGVYASLLRARRRELHARAADWFRERDPALHAQNLDRAEDPSAPLAYLEAAKSQLSDYRFERAGELVARGLEVATEPGFQYALTSFQGELRRSLGEPKESIAAYQSALALARTDEETCRAWIGIAAGARLLGGYDDGMQALDQAEPLARALALDRELSEVHYLRGSFHFSAGDIDDCLARHEEALGHARKAADPELEVGALSGLGDAYYARGRMRQALDCYRDCLELSREYGIGRIEVSNRFIFGVVRRYLNELEAGLVDVRAAVEMADKVGNQRVAMYANMILGEFLIERDEAAAAEAPLARSVAIAEAMGNERFRAYVLQHQARARIGQGHRTEAKGLLDQALELSRRTDAKFIGPRVLGTMALVAGDAEARHAAPEEGEAILRMGCAAHNVLWFYRDAIEASLAAREWEDAERYAATLEEVTRAEPLPWAEFFITRARALTAHGRSEPKAQTRAELENLLEQAHAIGFNPAMRALEAATGG